MANVRGVVGVAVVVVGIAPQARQVAAQPSALDFSNAPDCQPADVQALREVNERYLGIKGRNPSVPSTYGLIGRHKINGVSSLPWGGPEFIPGSIASAVFGKNWYPLRTDKQILSGIVTSFGISNFGNESDWNIHVVPSEGFESFTSDALVRLEGPGHTTADGKLTIEAEITPNEAMYGNPWFTNTTETTSLLRQRICAYGPFVSEEAHEHGPEIHPSEQIWWKEGSTTHKVLLLGDASNRFNTGKSPPTRVCTRPGVCMDVNTSDYATTSSTPPDYKAWTQTRNQEAELQVAFEADAGPGLYMGVQAVESFNFFASASYPDPSDGNKHVASYRGRPILVVEESPAIDQYLGVRFSGVCVAGRGTPKEKIQGYVVLNTATGNGSGKEGFVVLQIDRGTDASARRYAVTGTLQSDWNTRAAGNHRDHRGIFDWSPLAPFEDGGNTFANTISSDVTGKGIVDGMIDFNGNGKTDLFASTNNQWWVLYDAQGTWQRLQTSGVPLAELRFGDFNGDRKTDVVRVARGGKIQISYGGTEQWTTLGDGDQDGYQGFQVGDFNGDGKTDLTALKFIPPSPQRSDRKWHLYTKIRYGGQGGWKDLNSDYNLDSADEYSKRFYFGDFNGDRVTDLLRYRDKKLVVYWGGRGDFKVLSTQVPDLAVGEVMLANDLTKPKHTDVIWVDPRSREWTLLSGGRTGPAGFANKFVDARNVRFGSWDGSGKWQPLGTEMRSETKPLADHRLPAIPKVQRDAAVITRFVPGSLRRAADGAGLTASLSVKHTPGSGGGRDSSRVREVSATSRSTSRPLRFKAATLAAAPAGIAEAIGILEDVPVFAAKESEIELATGGSARAKRAAKLPGYGITAIPASIKETEGGPGDWRKWTPFLSRLAKPENAPLLETSPARPKLVKKVDFELLPLYGSVDEGKVSLVEVDGPAIELNEIAYGSSAQRSQELFGTQKVFEISWRFELTNLTTGQPVSLPNAAGMTANGKWPGSKLTFTFPPGSDLLELKALATVRDPLGNANGAPLEFVFHNQRINLPQLKSAVGTWTQPLKDRPGANHARVLAKAQFLAEDNILTPAELAGLLH